MRKEEIKTILGVINKIASLQKSNPEQYGSGMVWFGRDYSELAKGLLFARLHVYIGKKVNIIDFAEEYARSKTGLI